MVAFLFKQLITFLIGLMVVELGLLEFSVREFASINRTSFTFEYYAFTVVCAAFNVWYPIGRSIPIQFAYYAGYSSVLTSIEVIIEKYTDLIEYIHCDWYIAWITMCLLFLISRLFCVWFFTKEND